MDIQASHTEPRSFSAVSTPGSLPPAAHGSARRGSFHGPVFLEYSLSRERMHLGNARMEVNWEHSPTVPGPGTSGRFSIS